MPVYLSPSVKIRKTTHQRTAICLGLVSVRSVLCWADELLGIFFVMQIPHSL